MNGKEFSAWIPDPQRHCLLMGILNVTPDSFSDGGDYLDPKLAVERAAVMEAEGADLIDVGGESSRPGANPVSLKDELDRVLPVIRGIRSNSNIALSIDTTKAEVAEKALESGANIVNDISGLRIDPDMASVVGRAGVPVIIMHMQGTPRTMQLDPQYDDLIRELVSFFMERVKFGADSGIPGDRIVLDPGIGFGKRIDDNFTLIRELKQICDLGYPVLVGPSRKSFIGSVLNRPPEERLEGTTAAITASILNGAGIVRVHDVEATRHVILITNRIMGRA